MEIPQSCVVMTVGINAKIEVDWDAVAVAVAQQDKGHQAGRLRIVLRKRVLERKALRPIEEVRIPRNKVHLTLLRKKVGLGHRNKVAT